jgi:hypothetical protein
LKLADYFIGKLDDDFYSAAEKAELLRSKIEPLENNLKEIASDMTNENLLGSSGFLTDLTNAYLKDQKVTDMSDEDLLAKYNIATENDGSISQEAFLDGLKQGRDTIMENLEALNELDDKMWNYYGETLNMALEEIGKYSDKMSQLTGVLDHYHSIITLIDGEQAYDKIGTVLEGKVTTIKNEMNAANDAYEFAKREEEEARK